MIKSSFFHKSCGETKIYLYNIMTKSFNFIIFKACYCIVKFKLFILWNDEIK